MIDRGSDPWDVLTRKRARERALLARQEKATRHYGLISKILIAVAFATFCVLATGALIGLLPFFPDHLGPGRRFRLFLLVGVTAFVSSMFWLLRPPEADLKNLDRN